MDSRLLTLVLLASVAQCFCDQSSVASSKSSDTKKLPEFQRIKNFHNLTVLNELLSFGTVFDGLADRTLLRLNNVTIANGDKTRESVDAVALVKMGVTYSFDAVLAAVGVKTCDAAAKLQDAAHSDVDNGFKTVTDALTLAETSNGKETASAIEKHRVQLLSSFRGVLDKIFAAAPDCRSGISAEDLKVIKLGQRRTDYGLTRIVNVIFKAIQAYAAAVADGNVDLKLLTQLERYRATVIFSDVSELIQKFTLLEAVYVHYYGKTDLGLGDLYAIIRNGLSNTDSHNEHESGASTDSAENQAHVEFPDLAAEDVVTDKAIAEWVAEAYQTLQTTEKLSARSRKVIAQFVKRHQTADASKAVAAMKNMTTEAETAAVKYTVSFFNALIHAFDITEDIKAMFLTLRTAGNGEFKTITNSIAKANDLMADAASGKQTANLVSNISAEQAAVIAAVRNVDELLSY